MAKPPRIKDNGEPDMRGHGEGSKPTQFAAGDGRKRPGRRKDARDERTLVQLIKDMPVTVSMPGLPRRIDTQLAYLLKLRERALKGDLKAIDMLDRKLAQHAPPSVQPDLTRDLLVEDIEILRDARQRGALPPRVDQPGATLQSQDSAPGDHESNGAAS